MRVFYRVVFGKTHPLTAVYEKLIAQKIGVSQQERALERFLFGIHSQIDRYFERLVRCGTNAEENLPDLGTYMETCYHGGSLPESNFFVVAKDSVGHGGTGDKTESQLKREKERAQKKSLGKSVKNPDMNKEHRYTGRTTTELIKRTGEQPPKHANGKELSLIWHTKGECKEHCERKHSHYDAAPDIDKLPHPAAPMLHRGMKNGAPVVVHLEPWSQSQLDMQVARGCHSSANKFKEFLKEEFLDFGRKGFWILLPYDAIKDEKGLCLSPIGCIHTTR
ncbi:unnamed protein product [Cylindrotheca closterium]|uniref:Uncharacterized protein n=1 Tax=Cylindrotheca closterium TaxID=2856 RepID=A0AAD2CLI9_9STRA|nr:unnamed protein product [Cylindrotheca closterium]